MTTVEDATLRALWEAVEADPEDQLAKLMCADRAEELGLLELSLGLRWAAEEGKWPDAVPSCLGLRGSSWDDGVVWTFDRPVVAEYEWYYKIKGESIRRRPKQHSVINDFLFRVLSTQAEEGRLDNTFRLYATNQEALEAVGVVLVAR